jgi:ferredoxin
MDESGEKGEVIKPDAKITPRIEEAAAYCPEKCISFIRDVP